MINNNHASEAGGGLILYDSPAKIVNTSLAGNTAPQGAAVDTGRLYAGTNQATLLFLTMQWIPPHVLALPLRFGRSANPIASSAVNTSSAIFASGVSILITDTIIAGYGTDLATSGAPSSTIVGDYNLFDQTPVISGTVITGSHSIVGNPLFADSLGHLSAGSPAIDHGIDVGINVDLDGNPRPSGAGFDIGAYEFQVVIRKLFLPLIRR